MSLYDTMFERLATAGEGALGGFLMLGDPDLKTSARMLDALVAGGADMVEVGIPFSDPVADGPVIQAAAARALRAGVRTVDCFELIAGLRDRHPDVPIGILTYANLVVARGPEHFLRSAADAGADSLLVADLPVREAEAWMPEVRDAGLDPVLIATSNMRPQTVERLAKLCRGYTYCVTRPGITGTHAEARFDAALIRRLSDAGAPPPVFGFGISRPEHVRAALAAGAAGIIAGSALVSAAFERRDVGALVGSLKAATRNDSAPD
ncbi:MAG: tryptophan synthase subunit alpha [Sphingomicrobium sp.]